MKVIIKTAGIGKKEDRMDYAPIHYKTWDFGISITEWYLDECTEDCLSFETRKRQKTS